MTHRLTIEARPDGPGVVLVDDIQGTTVGFETPEAVTPTVESPADVSFPVDTLVRLETTAIRVPKFVNAIVREESGAVVAEGRLQQTAALPAGRYVVELESLDVKTYLFAEGRVETSVDDSGRVVTVGGTDHLRLGARSLHEFPAATMTTTDDPEDVMQVVSQFGSALKTTSPERAWPSLRGHPPLVERGDALDVPESVRRGEDDERPVTIRVPPRLDAVFPVASLAFYLDARVEPGDRPVLVADGVEHPLDTPDLETGAERTLRHLFFLDCVTRTEGLYPFALAERETVETLGLGLDFAALYDAPLGERTRRYLDVPFDALADHLPRWKTSADVRPVSASVEQVPFLVDDLCTIQCPGPRRDRTATPTTRTVREFARGEDTARLGARIMSDGGTARATVDDEATADDHGGDRIVGLPTTGSIEHVWVGDGYRMGAAKPTVAARKRRLAATSSGPIDVAVVVNDPEMHEEGDVRDLYGLRELVQFDVSVYEGLTRDELRRLFAAERDFVHFVGHVDERGLQCTDGYLDAATLDHVGTRAFVLNACQSYRQGEHLVEAGAIAGVVTFVVVGNEAATRIGRTLARLLNAGFSLGGALDVAGEGDLFAKHYGIAGDPNLTLASSRGSTPISAELERLEDGRYHLDLHGHPAGKMGPGAVYTPNVSSNERRYLNAGHIESFTVDGDQLSSFLRLERFPVQVDGRLHWSDSLRDGLFE